MLSSLPPGSHKNKGCISVVMQPKKTETFFFHQPLSLGYPCDNWSNCGNSKLQKKKSLADGGGKECELTGVRCTALQCLSKSVSAHICISPGSTPAVFLLDQWVTKSANLLIQQSVLLCLLLQQLCPKHSVLAVVSLRPSSLIPSRLWLVSSHTPDPALLTVSPVSSVLFSSSEHHFLLPWISA